MIIENQEMFDRIGNAVSIQKVVGNDIQALKTRVTTITFDNGTRREQQTHRDEVRYRLSDIGTLLFFKPSDYEDHSFGRIIDQRYHFNEKKIRLYFNEDASRIVARIKEDAPGGPLLTAELKTKLLAGYNSIPASKKEELVFHSQYKGCFGRIDLETEFYCSIYESYYKEKYYERIYISKRPYTEVPGGHIVNWRSAIASMYYDGENKSLTRDCNADVFSGAASGRNPYNVYHNELLLKRSYAFSPFKYYDKFIYGDEFFRSGVADEFLLDVMRSNRSNHEITDIIQSIQANQNRIIRQTADKSMIVQGCAGSGKTMILLHRLSYLQFNELLPSLSRVKIITPNINFSVFIENLASSLELESISRMTMSEYYLNLCKNFQKKYFVRSTRTISGITNQTEVAFYEEASDFLDSCAENVDSMEMTMQDNFGQYYLPESIRYLLELYADRTENFHRQINTSAVLAIAERFQLRIDGAVSMNKKEYFDKLLNIAQYEIAKANDLKVREMEKLERSQKYAELNVVIYEVMSLLNNLKNTVPEALSYKEEALELLRHKEEQANAMTELLLKSDKIVTLDLPASRVRDFVTEITRCVTKLQNGTWHRNEIETTIKKFESFLVRHYFSVTGEVHDLENPEIVESKISSIAASILTDTEIALLDRTTEELKSMPMFVIRLFAEARAAMGKKFGESKSKSYGRHDYFILLTLYALHCEPLDKTDAFLMIDEGQDYSAEEYKLISSINGPGMTVNIFGDLNQCITESAGIHDWAAIPGDFSRYELNENFRNTCEIAEYVNQAFGFGMSPIGIHGNPVKELAYKDLGIAIKADLSADSANRIAVIAKDMDIISQLGIPHEHYEISKIFAGTVWEAKGLEFDHVYVIPDGMSRNEKYISYTRALNQLVIVDMHK
ncbi:MAG: helicase domain-containing protein [Saccharofermentanales bacterium]